MENKEIKQFVENWMKTYGSDTFIPNEHGQMIYYSENKVSGLNLVCFFEDLLEEYTNSVSQQTPNGTTDNCNIPVVSNSVSCKKCDYLNTKDFGYCYACVDFNLFKARTDC